MRRAQYDCGSQPVRNLALNPRWETGSGINQIVRQNLCVNPRGVQLFPHYSGALAQTITANVAITGHPAGFTQAARFTYGPSASNPGINILNAPSSTTTYTMSAWVYIESLTSITGNGGFAENGVISGTSVDITKVGEWQRINWTRTTVATTGSCFGIRFAAVGGTGTGSILVTGVMVDTNPTDTIFFDGNTSTSGDFTYAWQGTANNSVSRELAPAPSLANSTGNAYRSAYLSTDRPAGHSKFLRLLTYTPNTAVALNPTDVQIKSGTPRTDLLWIRSNRTMTVSMRYRNPSGSVVVAAPAANLIANQWILYRNFQTPTGSDDLALGPLATTSIQAGDTIDLGPHMVVEGEYSGDIIDGSKPLSKWLGGADQSISVGYPAQLGDIAGTPLLDITTPNTTLTLPGGMEGIGRTFYTVYQCLQDIPSSPQPILITYGESALSDVVPNTYVTVRLEQGNGPASNIKVRRTGGAGPVTVNNVFVNTNVSCWGIGEDNFSFVQNNNGPLVTENVVMNVPHQKIVVWSNGVYHNHLRTVMFVGKHDASTRAAVSRYLGNKYGALVP